MSFFYRALLICTIVVLSPLLVRAEITSTNYQIDPPSNTPIMSHGTLSSTTYTLDGALDVPQTSGTVPTATGYQIESSASFAYFCGDGFRDPAETCDAGDTGANTCASQGFLGGGTLGCTNACGLNTSACLHSTTGGGGGGGGGTGSPVTPASTPLINSTFLEAGFFSYSQSLLLFGIMAEGSTVEVNGSAVGVTYPTSTTWNLLVPLTTGLNTFSVRTRSATGVLSEPVVSQVQARGVGDISADGRVDDLDLSRLSRLWFTADKNGDFNTDGTVSDMDFSLLAARWAP